jgi:hypothetical protein
MLEICLLMFFTTSQHMFQLQAREERNEEELTKTGQEI